MYDAPPTAQPDEFVGARFACPGSAFSSAVTSPPARLPRLTVKRRCAAETAAPQGRLYCVPTQGNLTGSRNLER